MTDIKLAYELEVPVITIGNAWPYSSGPIGTAVVRKETVTGEIQISLGNVTLNTDALRLLVKKVEELEKILQTK